MQIDKLSFKYGNTPVFKELSVSFKKNINIIVGPNAAGKSTMLKCIFGLLKAKGKIVWKGIDFDRISRKERMDFMVYLPQQDMTDTMLTVFETVLLGRMSTLGWKIKDEDLKQVYGALEGLCIAPLAERYVTKLSGGQKKLVSIAQTLVRNPEIILMDEPTNSLDLQKQLELFDIIGQLINLKNMKFIIVMHDINLSCRYAEHLTVLDGKGGVYASGSPAKVVTEKMLRDVYGVEACIVRGRENIPIVSPIQSIHKVTVY